MYPDFLCIGAQKAGTSWLYQNLQEHPDIWLPPIKEIHYFDYRHFTRKDVLAGIITGQRGHLRSALGQLVRGGRSGASRVTLMRYLIEARSDDWYQSLFEPARGRVTGDITPSYARLDWEDIEYIHQRIPDAKVIYLLRNPIERAWSQAAMRFSRSGGVKLGEPLPNEVIEFLRQQAVFERSAEVNAHHKSSDYLGNLDRWSSLYPSIQIFVGFLDEIAEAPEGFLLRLFEFLGVRASRDWIPGTAGKKVFSRAGAIPPEIAGFLADLYQPTLVKLHEHFANRYTLAWLEYAYVCRHAAFHHPPRVDEAPPLRQVETDSS